MAWIVEDDLLEYYRALLPKAWGICPPMRPAHVSIVRLFETVPNREAWGKYGGASIVVEYEPGIQSDGLYYWLDAWSDEICHIRRTLFLPDFREGHECHHLTIGNVKNNAKKRINKNRNS